MTNGQTEGENNRVDEVTHAREEVRQKASEIRGETNQAERDRKQAEYAQQLAAELESVRILASETETAIHSNRGTLPNDRRQEAKKIKASIAKVLEAVKEGLINPPEHSKELLTKLAEGNFTDQASVRLHNFVQKYLTDEISVSTVAGEKTSFEREFEQLEHQDPAAATFIGEALVDVAENMGLTREQARRKFSQEAISEHRKTVPISDEDQYENDLLHTFRTFFREPEDLKVLRAVYIPEEFIQMAKDTKAEIEERVNREPETASLAAEAKNAEIGRQTSEAIERKITLLFSKIYRGMDQFPPDKFFEEIEQAGFMESISVAKETFNKRFNQLIDKLSREQDNLPQELQEIGFYKRYSEQSIGKKETQMEDGRIEHYNYYRLTPTPIAGRVSLVDFLRGVTVQIGNEEASKRFLHNLRALFHRKPEEGKSFWDQLSAYSQSFDAVDIDALTTLPDSDLFTAANRLYQKYVEEAFASVSWMHQSNMFSKDLYTINTVIERKVMEDMRRMFPDLAKEGVDDWRLRRALSMGIGLSRGVWMNEVETAAWADPNVSFEEGKPTYASYYTNDNSALVALNPAHHFLRWQSESVTRGGLIFLLTEGFDPKQRRIWDHSQIFERIKYFRESFEKGVPALDRKSPEERMFFELLPNIGGVGSIITRGGWRTEAAYDGWIKRPENINDVWDIKDIRGGIKLLESWKALENIGYEAVYHFVENRLFDGENVKDFLLSKDAGTIQRKNAFLEYIYGKYIRPGAPAGEALSYLQSLEQGATEEVGRLIKRGKIPRGERDEKIQEEMYRRFMYRGLVRIIRQRIPTKFVRIERRRLSDDGVHAWEKIRERLGWDNDKMDETMQNLGMVETRLRQIISDKMRRHTIAQDKKPDLSTFQTDEYVVTEDRIRQILTEMRVEDVDSSIELFRRINSFLDEKRPGEKETYLEKFANKIRTKDAAGEKAPKNIPFALATEELENSFLAWRNAGPTPLTRALGDTAEVDKHISGQIQAYFDLLEQVAVDPKHDMSEMVKRLKDMKYSLEKIHDIGTATQLAYRMAAMTISYFKKDTMARNFFTKWFRFGKKNSLAAEFTGAYRGVWEWEVADIDNFVVALEQLNVLPKEPFDKMKATVEPRSFLGIKFGKKIIHEKSLEYYGGKLRKEFGASKKHITYELMNKYLPILLAFLLFQMIRTAFKKEFGEERR